LLGDRDCQFSRTVLPLRIIREATVALDAHERTAFKGNCDCVLRFRAHRLQASAMDPVTELKRDEVDTGLATYCPSSPLAEHQGVWGECASFSVTTVVRKLLQQIAGVETLDADEFRRVLVAMTDGFVATTVVTLTDALNSARDVTGERIKFTSQCGNLLYQIEVACHISHNYDALLALLDTGDDRLDEPHSAGTWCVVIYGNRPYFHAVAGRFVQGQRVGARDSYGHKMPIFVSRQEYAEHAILVPVIVSCQRHDGTVPDQFCFVGSTALTAVVAFMHKHAKDVALQVEGCRTLAKLLEDNHVTLRTLIGPSGVSAVLAAMRTYTSVAVVQEWGCRALAALALDTDIAILISSTDIDGASTVVSAMRAHRMVAKVQEAGCHTLSILALVTDVASLIGSAGVGCVPAVVAAMRMHTHVAAVQQAACRALVRLALDATNRTLIGSSAVGGAPAVLAAMRAHVDVVAVQEWGCEALANLAVDTNRTLIEPSCVTVVVEAMRAHVDVVAIQIQAGRVFELLARHGIHKAAIREANGVLAIVTAMRTHCDQINLLELAYKVLFYLSDGNPSNMALIASTEVLPSLIVTMCRHVAVPSIQQVACDALRVLARDPTHRAFIGASDGVPAVVQGMKAHAGELSVQEAGFKTLGNLAIDTPANRDLIALTGGVQVVIAALRAFQNSVLLQELGCLVLRNLTIENAHNVQLIASSGGIEAVVCAMNTHEKNALQEWACQTLLISVTPPL
jgi:hypothetical protein